MEKGTSDQNWRTELSKEKHAKCKGLNSVEWEELKARQERGNTGRGKKARARTSLSHAGDRKQLLAGHSGMNKYINSYVDGQKNDCDRVCEDKDPTCQTSICGPLVQREDAGTQQSLGKLNTPTCS